MTKPTGKLAFAYQSIARLEAERDALRQQRDKLAGLLRKVLATHKRWPDLAPSLSLCADIKAALSELTP